MWIQGLLLVASPSAYGKDSSKILECKHIPIHASSPLHPPSGSLKKTREAFTDSLRPAQAGLWSTANSGHWGAGKCSSGVGKDTTDHSLVAVALELSHTPARSGLTAVRSPPRGVVGTCHFLLIFIETPVHKYSFSCEPKSASCRKSTLGFIYFPVIQYTTVEMFVKFNERLRFRFRV